MTGAFLTEPSNVHPIRPQPAEPVVDSPPTGTELLAARHWANGWITTRHLTFICDNQIRAGRAIDAYLKGRR